ncbi:hypothetical protein B0G69_6438 [Paraburkholderia sp. RAU2J]|uniref:hypothetical protein n=1 Tax=Paraburkholderia sp. RAU2J TaxID=1938810 RepID=UPI000EAD6732|nr:hypothetical protein [Paraburkholderia sp. RAU2J]RKT13309.1 hypothetical protein B0G69_6438 [Paraburkholderia sp. RAU2J]
MPAAKFTDEANLARQRTAALWMKTASKMRRRLSTKKQTPPQVSQRAKKGSNAAKNTWRFGLKLLESATATVEAVKPAPGTGKLLGKKSDAPENINLT